MPASTYLSKTIILREIGSALRLVRRNKSFALAVRLSTALGVGAGASIFSLIHAFLLRALPVPRHQPRRSSPG
jgi:hypothetical protein